MRILDSRRLIGPNMQMLRPGVVAEVLFEPGEDPAAAVEAWRAQVGSLSALLALAVDELRARPFAGGAVLSFAAPTDVLLAASDLNDLAIARATDAAAGQQRISASEPIDALRAAFAAQFNPRLLALEAEAKKRGVPFLADDDTLSLGMGARSLSLPLGAPHGVDENGEGAAGRAQAGSALPSPDEVRWSELGRVPTALITGTNGKTTSARLLAHLLAQSGARVGLAATDFVSVGGEILERGDFTGPAAARLVLRDPRVEVAVLETARGGILRRGLAIDSADCALITNVADDHLGEYGIDSVRALARAKAVVARAVRPDGRIALNADNDELVSLWREAPELFGAPIVWFSLAPQGPARALLEAHLAAGGEAMLLEEGQLVRRAGAAREPLLAARELPISFGGAAAYNLANALGASALAFALGLSRETIARGLASFRPDGKDNPGRSNLLEGPGGVRVLVDFGHNAHGVHQLGALVAALRAARPGPLTTLGACAGDRSDENLRALAVEIAAMQPRRVLLRDLLDYLRGRAPGEVPQKMAALLEGLGLAREALSFHESEAAALRAALDSAQPGELILILVHLESEAVGALLESRGFRSA